MCLCCLMSISTIFQLYYGGQFYWWKKPEYREKTTDLTHVKLTNFHIILHRVHCKATLYLLLKFPVSPLPGGCNPR
jgi:hypothetical protein